mgnify:CR=1 FL=1
MISAGCMLLSRALSRAPCAVSYTLSCACTLHGRCKANQKCSEVPTITATAISGMAHPRCEMQDLKRSDLKRKTLILETPTLETNYESGEGGKSYK